MKLPNGEGAIVDNRKLEGYCLNVHHSRGRNKARVFASVGIQVTDAEMLREALLTAAKNSDAQSGMVSPYGQRYIVDFDLVHHGRTVRIRSTWIVRMGGLTAAYELLCTMKGRRFVMADIEMHSVVALLEDLTEDGLVRGQVGTVVEHWAPGVYEVEFCDDSGRTYAMVALKGEQLMRLHYEPAHQAA